VNARSKLKEIAEDGVPLATCIVGLAIQSWTVFWIVSDLLLLGDMYVVAIRLSRIWRRRS
jgi:hypothetical protein